MYANSSIYLSLLTRFTLSCKPVVDTADAADKTQILVGYLLLIFSSQVPKYFHSLERKPQ